MTLYYRTTTPGGRVRYLPSPDYWDLRPGSYLMAVEPGMRTIRPVVPDHAAVAAAALALENAMTHAMLRACEVRPSSRWIGDDPVLVEAWEAYADVLRRHGRPVGAIAFDGVSINDVVQAGVARVLDLALATAPLEPPENGAEANQPGPRATRPDTKEGQAALSPGQNEGTR